MSKNTVAEFAAELRKTPQELLEQLQSAGVPKSGESDVISEADKIKLRDFLRTSQGEPVVQRKKIVLTKKSTSEIKQADATGKARTIQVEVRKKRTLVKRDEAESSPAEQTQTQPAASVSVIDTAELQRREEEARRQAELIRRQEEDLAERRRQREEQEAKERAEQQAAQEAAQQTAQEAGQQAPEAAADKEQEEQARALARELGSRGITVNCVAPGFIDTDMTANLPKAQQDALQSQIPLGHLGKPADIAHAVAYLASAEAGYVTGQELHVNGGMYM